MKNSEYVSLNVLDVGELFTNMNGEQYIVFEKYDKYFDCGRIIDTMVTKSARLSPYTLVKRVIQKVRA